MSDLEKKNFQSSSPPLPFEFFFLSLLLCASSQNFFFSSPTHISLSSSNHHARNDDTIDDEERVCATQRRKRSRRTRTTTTTTSGKERAEGDYCIEEDFVFFGIRYRKNERDRENDDYSKRTSPELALFDVRRRARVSVIWCFVTVSSKCGDGIYRRPRARLWKS